MYVDGIKALYEGFYWTQLTKKQHYVMACKNAMGYAQFIWRLHVREALVTSHYQEAKSKKNGTMRNKTI